MARWAVAALLLLGPACPGRVVSMRPMCSHVEMPKPTQQSRVVVFLFPGWTGGFAYGAVVTSLREGA